MVLFTKLTVVTVVLDSLILELVSIPSSNVMLSVALTPVIMKNSRINTLKNISLFLALILNQSLNN